MKKLRHSQLYNPLGLIRQHQVYFNTESLDAYEGRLVAQTIQYLNGLTCEQLKRQSVQLFKWLVVHQPTTLQIYATELLEYFHTKGLLLNKHSICKIVKHHQPKYLVVYTIEDGVFTQQYNSIREIRDDTGLKGRKFISNKTTNILI